MAKIWRGRDHQARPRRGRANDSEGVRHLPSSWEEAENGGQGRSARSVGVKEIWGEGASGTLELQRALETEIVDMLKNGRWIETKVDAKWDSGASRVPTERLDA